MLKLFLTILLVISTACSSQKGYPKRKDPIIGIIGLGEIDISGKLRTTKMDSTAKRVKKKQTFLEIRLRRIPAENKKCN